MSHRFIGLPLCVIAFGRDSSPLATTATVLTACVLFAIMPAELYQRDAAITSQTILLSTIASLFTISGDLAWIG